MRISKFILAQIVHANTKMRFSQFAQKETLFRLDSIKNNILHDQETNVQQTFLKQFDLIGISKLPHLIQ